MSGNKKHSKRKSNSASNSAQIDADFRIKIEKTIENFVNLSNDHVYEFPPSLTNVERAFVHNIAPKYNLMTKSEGQGVLKYFILEHPKVNNFPLRDCLFR